MSVISGLIPKAFRWLDYRSWKLVFSAFYARGFRGFGHGAFIGHPVKIEGAGGITVGPGAVVLQNGWLAALPLLEGVEPRLELGAGCYVGRSCHIVAIKGVSIGAKALIADRVYISDNVHVFENPLVPVMDQPVKLKGEVCIGEGAWLGENVCVIGASVGRNSVVGANSVVTRDIPDHCVAVGSPARIVKRWDGKSWVKTSGGAP